ncbi:MAG: RHS repeat-associated core domain-containing protein [Endozoicomonadaceae bacterium]|nr:RHS repeat-associated core domain-containing protein [Endozoicomonadaceae bacterium]
MLFFALLLLIANFLFLKQTCLAIVHPRNFLNNLTVKSHSEHPSSQKKDKYHHLTSFEDDEKPWSNAFNFQTSWGTVVDPRTGILMVHFKVGSLLSNIGHGPDINLQINYSSNTLANPDGIGAGWSWNLTHFNTITNQLTTAGGQSFWLHQSTKNHWEPLYHKLYDIKIDGNKYEHFIITYANGLREILSHDGYQTRMEQQNGWGVNFIYHQGTHLLQAIVDDEGNKIIIDRSQGYLDIISHNSDGKPAIIRVENHNNKPYKMTFLLAPTSTNLSINLNYKNHLLSHVIYPTGLEKKFAFNCTDAMKFPVFLSGYSHALCVVMTEYINPGAGQPVMKTHYFYSNVNVNGHNYLGFNSGLNTVTANQKDLLFEAPADYSYRTVSDNGLVKNIHVYNKYHLLIDDKLISDHTGKILSETENFFCDTKMPDGCSRTSFADLPVTYSLPLKIVSRVWGTSSGQPAVTTVTRAYDRSGRVIRSKDTYGRVMHTHYCPITGDAACPAMPHDWPFSRLTESISLYPAFTSGKEKLVNENTVYNFYRKQFNLHGSGYILILDHQIRHAGYQRIMLKRRYYTDRFNRLTYGLLKQVSMMNIRSSQSHAIIYDYHYIQNIKNHSRTTYSRIELSLGKWQKLPSVVTSMFTNQVLERTERGGKNKRQYHYDEFGRIIQVDRDTGTVFAAKSYYQYLLYPGNNQVILTAVNGLQQKIVFDNSGRELMHFKEMISVLGKPVKGQWQLKKKIYYDSYGRVTEKKTYMRDAANKLHVLKVIKDYDDMGRISHIHLPDGRVSFLLYDNTNNCMVSYQKSSQGKRSPVYIMQSNLLDKPTKQCIIPASSELLPSLKLLCSFKKMVSGAVKINTITYDGWGRPVMTKDAMGKIVRKHYDALGHTDDITDPAGNHIHLVYNLNGQVVERWALPISGKRYLLSSAGYNNAGQLLYKAGEDGKKTVFTYTETGQPATAITPNGHLFSWQYNEAGLPIKKFVDGNLLLQTDYDHIMVKPIKKHDVTGITTWKYSVDGLVEKEVHSGENGYPDYQLSWRYNGDRHIVSISNVEGKVTHIKYDNLGRISALFYHSESKDQMLYTLTYNEFSHISTINYGSGMQRSIHYDHWGRQLEVTDTMNSQLLFRWQFGYDPDNNIIRLQKQADHHQEAILDYQYDQLDNLVSMHCEGSFSLPLCPRDTAFSRSGLKYAPIITSQNYTFTPLNRLSQVKEVLQDAITKHTLNKVVTYHYSDIKVPLRLQQTETQWNQQIPVIQHLHYDNAGNMMIDGEGSYIAYNIFNQVDRAIKSNGEQSHYIYDAKGLERLEENTLGRHYLFYNGTKLINEKIITSESNENHMIGYYGVARTIDGILCEYTEQNYKNDIIGIFTKITKTNNYSYALTQRNIYSPYGMVWHNKPMPLALQERNFFGFDGERTDPTTGWQFLGSGHRTYNPQQRYFLSEDPAGNGYAFASNNPVMKTDPSGNIPKSLKRAFDILRDISTFGLSAIHSHWGATSGSLLMWALNASSLGLIVGIKTGNIPVTLITIIANTLLGLPSLAASIVHSNKGLNIAAASIGVIQFGVIAFSTGYVVLTGINKCMSFIKNSLMAEAESVSVLDRSLDDFADNLGCETTELRTLNEGINPVHLSDDDIEFYGSSIPGTIEEEDLFHVNTVDDLYKIQAELNSPDSDTGIILAAACLKKQPLDAKKLQNLLLIRNDASVPDTEYRSAFKDLMSDLDLAANIPEKNRSILEQLFPEENGITLFLSHKYIHMLQKQETEEFSLVVIDANGYLDNVEKSYHELLDFCCTESATFPVDEYYRVE